MIWMRSACLQCRRRRQRCRRGRGAGGRRGGGGSGRAPSCHGAHAGRRIRGVGVPCAGRPADFETQSQCARRRKDEAERAADSESSPACSVGCARRSIPGRFTSEYFCGRHVPLSPHGRQNTLDGPACHRMISRMYQEVTVAARLAYPTMRPQRLAVARSSPNRRAEALPRGALVCGLIGSGCSSTRGPLPRRQTRHAVATSVARRRRPLFERRFPQQLIGVYKARTRRERREGRRPAARAWLFAGHALGAERHTATTTTRATRALADPPPG